MKNASDNEILDFLRSRGIFLKGEALQAFIKKIREEPVSNQTFSRSKELADNEHFMQVLDHSFARRIEVFEESLKDNPFFQLVKDKRGEIKKENSEDKDIVFLRHDLAKIFYDKGKWESFDPLEVDLSGKLIVKASEHGRPKPFIACLFFLKDDYELMTTRRKLNYRDIVRLNLNRLKCGDSGAEKTKNINIQKAFYDYITGFRKK